jgi:inorganic pyrophosphatase
LLITLLLVLNADEWKSNLNLVFKVTDAKDWKVLHSLYQAHPWHGIHIGDKSPEEISVYVEIVPTDTVKYELDKASGILKIDRPQLYSNVCPTLYGLIPQTLCGTKVCNYCMEKTGKKGLVGDMDPLDICIIGEKPIERGDVIMSAIPIGGLRMIDEGDEVDDKIIAVMKDDPGFGQLRDIKDCPAAFIDRLRHYFLTYKIIPGKEAEGPEITHIYGREEAHHVIRLSQEDYQTDYAEVWDFFCRTST